MFITQEDYCKLPGVASARCIQSFTRHDPPELPLAQRLLQHQAPPGELKLLINLRNEIWRRQ